MLLFSWFSGNAFELHIIVLQTERLRFKSIVEEVNRAVGQEFTFAS